MCIKEIKIIKRNNTEKKPQSISQTAKVNRDIHYRMIDEVNNWISERSETRRAEKIYSDGKISDWKLFSNDLSKTKI